MDDNDVIAARRAAINPFCVIKQLHFCTFLLSLPDYIFREPMKHRFQRFTAVRKYCQLFTRESNTFLAYSLKRTGLTAHTQTDGQRDKSENSISVSFIPFTWRI